MAKIPAPSIVLVTEQGRAPALPQPNVALRGYAPIAVCEPVRRRQPGAPAQPVTAQPGSSQPDTVQAPAAGLRTLAQASAHLGIPAEVMARLARSRPDLLPPCVWVAGEPYFSDADLDAAGGSR